jgi:hypothetical protein
MMTPGPITLLATIADSQAAAGLTLAPDALAAMAALRDLIRSQPWSRESADLADEIASLRRVVASQAAALAERAPVAAPPAPVPMKRASTPRQPRAKVEPRPGTRAAADLADSRAWKASGDPRGARMERAILRAAADERAHLAFLAAHPGPVLGRVTWLDADGRPTSPPRDLRSWCAGHQGCAEYDAIQLGNATAPHLRAVG